MTAMIIAVDVTLLSMLVITEDATIILLSPPLPTRLLLLERGGGLESDSTRLREEDGPFPPSHPLPPPFPSLHSPPLTLGHLRR